MLVPTIITASHAHQFHRPHAAAVRHMRPPAQIHVVAGSVDGDWLPLRDVRQTLQLIRLVPEKLLRLLPRQLFTHERQLRPDQFANGLLDRREILRAQTVIQVKIIIKTIVGRRPNINLYIVKQRTHRRRHQMRRAMSDFLNRHTHVCSLKSPTIISDSLTQRKRMNPPQCDGTL